MTAAQRLLALARAECALVDAGRVDEADELGAAWDAALAALPTPLDPLSAAYVREALQLTRRAAAALEAARDAAAAELRRLDRTRAGARGYVPADAPGLPSFDRAA
jgi:hypothetical protein